jgi:hypothetical protein
MIHTPCWLFSLQNTVDAGTTRKSRQLNYPLCGQKRRENRTPGKL